MWWCMGVVSARSAEYVATVPRRRALTGEEEVCVRGSRPDWREGAPTTAATVLIAAACVSSCACSEVCVSGACAVNPGKEGRGSARRGSKRPASTGGSQTRNA
jgi:hypothetical protein